MGEPSGLIFDIRRGSEDDGPGLRSTVYLKGCPLRCIWCHNPESQQFRPEVMLDYERCNLCGACVPVCDPGRHQVSESGHALDTAISCRGCLVCAEVCEEGAIEVVGQVRSLGEVMALLEADAEQYERTGGGVTLSGGEPLFQTEFCLALLDAARGRGWHTALDTCGMAPPDIFAAALGLVDLVLFDLKETDPALHPVWTGVELDPILDNLYRAASNGKELWIRLPVVPMLNDREEHWDEVGRIIAALPGPPPLYLLPYQPNSQDKRRRLGVEADLLEGVEEPDAERLSAIAGQLEAFGLEVRSAVVTV